MSGQFSRLLLLGPCTYTVTPPGGQVAEPWSFQTAFLVPVTQIRGQVFISISEIDCLQPSSSIYRPLLPVALIKVQALLAC